MRALTEDAATALLCALSANIGTFRGHFRVDSISSRPWASVTFSGARHRIAFTLEGEGAAATADAFAARLGDAEFDMSGHILADIALVGDERSPAGDRVQVRIEALTVEDR
ncbi:MAG TPA: hypothetical protein VF702_03690 [Allosphingosinicella sp.]|jgi:hypothetical protein